MACNAHSITSHPHITLSSLLPLAPTLDSLMRPPSAVLAMAELHLHAMLATPAFRWLQLASVLILHGEALEQRFQPRQQPLFVAIAQGHLYRAASESDVDIRTGRRLWQCWRC